MTLNTQSLSAIAQHISQAVGEKVAIQAEPKCLTGGSRRRTYKLDTDCGAYVVSINPSDFPVAGNTQHLQHFLYDLHAPVPKPIGDIGLLPTGEWFQVAEFIPSKYGTPKRPNAQDMEAFGEALGRIHALSTEYFREHGIDAHHNSASWRYGARLLGIADAAERHAVKQWLKDGTSIPDQVKHAAAELKRRAVDASTCRMKHGLTHKDAHTGNMIINEDSKAVLVDLELCGKGLVLQDMVPALLWGSTSVFRNEQGLHIRLDSSNADAFLAGYRREHTLTAQEEKILFALVRDEAKTIVAFSQKHPFPESLAIQPDDYVLWNQAIDAWAHKLAHRTGGQTSRF